MRFAFVTAAAVLSVGIATAFTVSPVAAQKKKAAAAPMSVNECIDLARKRGYTESDLGNTGGGTKGNPARSFVIGCLQGRQR